MASKSKLANQGFVTRAYDASYQGESGGEPRQLENTYVRTEVGSQAGSQWMSDDLMDRAASKDKQMHIASGANHTSLYDRENFVNEAAKEVGGFFQTRL